MRAVLIFLSKSWYLVNLGTGIFIVAVEVKIRTKYAARPVCVCTATCLCNRRKWWSRAKTKRRSGRVDSDAEL